MTRKPKLPGTLVPVYDDVSQQIRATHDGYGLLGSTSTLAPMVFYEVSSPKTPAVRLVSTQGTNSYEIPGVNFDVYRNADSTETWYVWDVGTSMGFTVPVGEYYVQFTAANTQVSEVLSLCNICMGFSPRLAINSVSVGPPVEINIEEADIGSDSVLSEKIGYVVNGNMVDFSTTSNYTFAPPFSSSDPFHIRRVVTTPCGVFTADYGLFVNNADPERSAVLDLTSVDYSPVEDSKGIWYIEIGNDTDSNNIPYETGFRQRYYFKPTFGAPDAPEVANFLPNGEGKRKFQSTVITDNIVFEMYRVPDVIKAALTFARSHDTKKLVNTVTGFEMDLEYFDIQFAVAEDRQFNTAVITAERARIVHRACNDSLNLVAV